MNIFGYCRVSTLDQNPQMQIDAILATYPVALIRHEKISGTKKHTERPMLELLLEVIGQDDKLVVWKLDRLGRSLLDILNVVEKLASKGASLEVLDQRIDTGTASGKAFLHMLGVFAEFENAIRKERQMAGIAKAKSEGRLKGRPSTVDASEVNDLLAKGMTPAAIQEKLGISRTSFYRAKFPQTRLTTDHALKNNLQ